MLDFILCFLAMGIALCAVFLNIISLPGNWVVLLVGLVMSIAHGGSRPFWPFLIVIFLVLLAAEVVEFLSGMIGARKFGASKAAAWAAIAGALLGGIIGIPPLWATSLGTDHIVAAVLGAFLFAWIVELLKKKPLKEASMAALGAALGKGAGIVTKIAAGVAAWFILLGAWLFPIIYHWFA